jgi:hypothetical protein
VFLAVDCLQHVAMAAIWLACKLEEVIEIDNPQRLTLRNVITVADRVIRRRDGRSLSIMDPYSQAGAAAVILSVSPPKWPCTGGRLVLATLAGASTPLGPPSLQV